jgi:hypothetical protein
MLLVVSEAMTEAGCPLPDHAPTTEPQVKAPEPGSRTTHRVRSLLGLTGPGTDWEKS